MSSVGVFFLVHAFSALLPPIPENETSYYDILEVSSSASTDDIRKAYKKKSLMLHPDKVTQRGGNVEEAKEEYQRVQEAHTVLADESKRKTYDMLQKSPTRYQFVSSGLNPGAMYENLAQASVCDKTRLVVLGVVLVCMVLLQPILICAKINQVVGEQGGALEDIPWTLILIPWWILYGLVVVVTFLVFIITGHLSVLVHFLESAAWWVGQFLLALRWDRTITNSYAIVFIPIYVALGLRWLHKILTLREIQHALSRMVTLDYIQEHVLVEGRHYQDLTEEERHAISQKYVLVHVPPDAHCEDEESKVEASPEYQSAAEAYNDTMNDLIAGILVSTTFVALVVAKVDGAINVSWWVVFVPIWVSFGLQLLWSVFRCCCAPVAGSEIIVVGPDAQDTEEEEEVEEKREDDPLFASVEGSIRRYQQSSPKDAAQAETESTSKDSDSQKDTKPEEGTTTESKTTATNSESNGSTPAKEADEEAKVDDIQQYAVTPESDQKDDQAQEATEDDDDEAFFMDEDMRREWESAYQEAEHSAMEAQAKAQAECCGGLFQIMLLCLLVGKLEQDYERAPNESTGYSAFWIIFPVFVVFGCVLCSCACIIYGAGESQGMDHLVERVSTRNVHEHGADEEAPRPEEEETSGDPVVDSKDETAVEDTTPSPSANPPPAAAHVSDIEDLD